MTRIKILQSITLLVLTVALMAGATAALFSSEAAVEENRLTAGKLEISIEEGITALPFNAMNLKPGDLLETSVSLQNTGTLPFLFNAFMRETGSNPDVTAAGYLPQVLELTIALENQVIFSDTLAFMLHHHTPGWIKLDGQELVLGPGETVEVTFSLSFDLSAGNEYQGAAWEGAIVFEAVQSEFSDWQATGGNKEDTGGVPSEPYNAALDPAKFSASRTDSGNPSNLAYSHDHDNEGIWQINVGGSGISEQIGYNFTTPQTVVQYALRATNGGDRAPGSWELQGSNDGSSWSVIDAQSGITFAHYEEKTFTVMAQQRQSYRYYRILIVGSNHPVRTALSVVKLFIY